MESHTEHLWIETPRGFEQGTNSLERFIGSLSCVWRNVGSVINLAGFPLVEAATRLRASAALRASV